MGDHLNMMIPSPVCADGSRPSSGPGKSSLVLAAARTPATIWQRLKRPLLTQKGMAIQVRMDLLVCSIYWAMRDVYNLRYKRNSEATCCQHQRLIIGHSVNHGHQVSAAASHDWQWRDWPPLWPWLTGYRVFSCAWMAYVLIKTLFGEQLAQLIKFVFRLSLPADCYLPGRFIIDVEIQRMTGTLIASLHLLWRYIQFKKYNRLDMSIVYFLLLDERDITKYYTLLTHPAPPFQQHRQWQPSESGEHMRQVPLGSRLRPPHTPVDQREQMMHDIMSYRVDYKEGEVFRLRPNRTPEACARLRNTMSNINLLLCPILTLNTLIIAPLFLRIGTQARHALSDYPGCNPRLEQAVKSGQMQGRSFYLSEHVPYVLPWDFIENWLLWFDSGSVCYIAPGFMYMFNHDLMIYWEHLHNKIDYVHRVVRDLDLISDHCSPQGPVGGHIGHEPERWLDELVFDLQMQIRDMIKQIKQADCFLTDAASSYLVIWFALFAFFIYKSATARDGSLPLPLLLPLLLVAVVVTVVYASLLTLHRSIHKSYPLICSLMAHDRSKHKRNFISILDYFAHNRTCYTIFRLKSMTATSYLTIVGWSFSCYFLLSKV